MPRFFFGDFFFFFFPFFPFAAFFAVFFFAAFFAVLPVAPPPMPPLLRAPPRMLVDAIAPWAVNGVDPVAAAAAAAEAATTGAAALLATFDAAAPPLLFFDLGCTLGLSRSSAVELLLSASASVSFSSLELAVADATRRSVDAAAGSAAIRGAAPLPFARFTGRL